MNVHMEELDAALKYLSEINESSLVEITWIRGEEIITPSAECIEEWRFIGLNNTSFAEFNGL